MAWGKFRADVVTLLSLITLAILGILTPAEAIAGFSNPIVLMLAGLFIVSGAINQTGLAKKISTYLLQLAGDNHLKLFLITLLVTAFFSSFMSNYGTVALLLPIVVSMTRETKMDNRRMLMPMAFAASMGGMFTLIGAPPNLIANDALTSNGFEGLGFFTVFPIGVVLLIVGIIYLWYRSPILERSTKKCSDTECTKSPFELVREYQLAESLFRIKLPKQTPILHTKLKDLNITQKYNVTIVEIRSMSNTSGKFFKSESQYFADGDTILKPGDIIYVEGSYDDAKIFAQENGLAFMDASETESDAKPEFKSVMKFDEIGVAEAVILSSSRLINKQVKETAFRKRYFINILAIRRKNEYLINQIQNERIHSGDTLLIQGSWANIAELGVEEPDLVIVGQPIQEANKVILEHKAGVAGFILLAMILCITFKVLSPVISILAAAILMIITGCFRNVETAYQTIRWQNVIFFAAMLPMATAMQKTGASEMISNGLVELLGGLGPHFVMVALYIITALFTMFVSNTATVIIFAPIALHTALTLGVSPYPFVLAVATAGVMCLASPYATPPNAIILSTGQYGYMDYVRLGLPLQLIYVLVMVLLLPLLYPF